MNLIGMLWNRNEADILEEVIRDAAAKVDALYIADGFSTDRSWEIIGNLKAKLPNIEHIQQLPEFQDRAQRNSLLNLIRARYKPQDTWVQVIESDTFILDTDIREAIRLYAVEDMAVTWKMLNACRPRGQWRDHDTWPRWGKPIREVMPYAHEMEQVLYTFRPLPELSFDHQKWRPWPNGFTAYTTKPVQRIPRGPRAPLILHCGYRGPSHFHAKYKHMGHYHTRYKSWRVDSPEAVEQTVSFFNGHWNANPFAASRMGWLEGRAQDVRIPAIDTAADLIERLIIINNRMAWLEQQKRDGASADPHALVKFDQASRDCCEARSAVKNRINILFEEIVSGESYRAIRESRSFRPPPDRFADTLDHHCLEIAGYFTSRAFGESIRGELLGEQDAEAARRVDDPPEEGSR